MTSYPVSQEAAYFSDQIGAFEVHPDAAKPGNKVRVPRKIWPYPNYPLIRFQRVIICQIQS